MFLQTLSKTHNRAISFGLAMCPKTTMTASQCFVLPCLNDVAVHHHLQLCVHSHHKPLTLK